ncbi:SMC-Scp complex subunit ScpB [Bacillus sp. FJAT-45350]|uniref:SMC-Scp complex subunit ScpB n=1 Tax=Bacillus sp. FJAT-45350 TaxID=2011014 RepID=UPI000BB943B5|nr:SMC-Scp complex subunit ScpB [Bacillus sp. FJAT-45350]
MTLAEMKAIIEGLLFVTGDEGMSIKEITNVLEVEETIAKDALLDLMASYRIKNKGLRIVEVAGSFKMTTKPEHASYFQKLAQSPTHNTLSQAALETLAIIAYKQPITRVDIEEVRGVKAEKAIQTLASKYLIKEVGRLDGVGRAILYGTTKEFLDYFGLNTIEELPPLPEMIDEDSVEDEADLFFRKFEESLEPQTM